MIEEIEDFADPRLAPYRALKDAPLVRSGRFVAEGELVVRTLIERQPDHVESVLFTAPRATRRSELLEKIPESVPVWAVTPEIAQRVAGFPVHRGFLAIGRERDRSEEAAHATGPIVVLEQLSNHDNVGGIFRAAAAFGAGAVWLDERTADPLYRKALRVSMGSVLRVPYRRARFETLAASLVDRRFSIVALTPRPGARPLGELTREVEPKTTAFLVGAEGHGLTETALHAATAWARIPIEREVDSLNAATALAIALYALRDRELVSMTRIP
ncbi:MAG: RNA methyltransferase [Deltaproteobacteria bacterium]|nr:RNA methyltransferase [Deltaproteobacteria bacterium]